MKTTKTTNVTSNLDAVRAAIRQQATTPAPVAAPAPAEAPKPASWPPADQPKPVAASQPAAAPEKPAKPVLKQFNVRLTISANARLNAAAHRAGMSAQEFLERFAMTLPEPAAPELPWEKQG